MNLHQFSQNTNIEAGVILQHRGAVKKLTSIVTNASDAGEESIHYFGEVIEHSELLFMKKAEFDEGFLKSKTYKGSVVEVDRLEDFFAAKGSSASGGNARSAERVKPIIDKKSEGSGNRQLKDFSVQEPASPPAHFEVTTAKKTDGVSKARPHREEKTSQCRNPRPKYKARPCHFRSDGSVL